MTKPSFFWCNGTSWTINLWDLGWFPSPSLEGPKPATIYGINGRSAWWDGTPQNDAFPSLVDANAWNVTKVKYPAAAFPALGSGGSITIGIANVVAAINKMPAGTPFALGGYSQGAFVMSQILKEMQSGSLTSRYSQFKGAVMFGNPCRLVNDLWPAHNGLAGGLWSGAWDNAGSTTGGGGCMPAPYRLTSTPDSWFEFVGGRTHYTDPVCSNSTSGLGGYWIEFNQDLLNNGPIAIAAAPIFHADTQWAAFNVANQHWDGHGEYPLHSPPGYGPSDPTSYQIALGYLDSIAAELATAPLVLPTTTTTTTTAAWSTTLIPPAA